LWFAAQPSRSADRRCPLTAEVFGPDSHKDGTTALSPYVFVVIYGTDVQ